MKKLIVLVLALICVIGLVGCSDVTTDESLSNVTTEGSLLLRNDDVKKISVSSQPEGYNYSFEGEDAEKVIDYLSNLNLIEEFEENPNYYNGMTWVISLEYSDGDVLQIYHFGNMFIRSEKGSWYKMIFEEANRFNTLLDELNN